MTTETVRNVPRVPVLDPGLLPRTPELLTGLFEPSGPVEPPPPELCGAWTLAGPLFDTDSFQLDEAALPRLDELAAQLRTATGTFEVGGHADERTTRFPGGNDALSKARADAVRKALVDREVPEDRFLSSIGHGPRRPVDPRSSPDAYRVNRRVEVTRLCL